MNLIKEILTAQAAVLALWTVSAQTTTTNDAIVKRLEPVGKACVQGKEYEDAGVVAVAASGGGTRSGEDIAGKTCSTCHSAGLLGAPGVGDKAEWNRRAEEQNGLNGLPTKVTSGVSAMPPKGTCADCPNDELKAAIEHISGL